MVDQPSQHRSDPDEVEEIVCAKVTRLLELPQSAWQGEIDRIDIEDADLAGEVRNRLQALVASGLLHQNETLPMQPPAPQEAPRRLGHYRLLDILGTGGQGKVYLAEDTRLGRRVAIKVLPGAALLSERARARLRREAEALSRLDHPGICAVYDVSEAEDTPFIAMRFVEGQSLSQLLAETRKAAGPGGRTTTVALAPQPTTTAGSTVLPGGRKSVLAIVRLFERAARALHAAHEAGIIHRDVKPGNLMVTPNGEPVLLDFGLARDEDSVDLTRTGDLMGTPAYMSPEQLAAKRIQLDRRTDVYSLAVTLYECLTLRNPAAGPSAELIYQSILTKPPPKARRLNPAIPTDLEVVLETALEKDRDRRYRTAAAFADDLRAIVESRPVAARPISTWGRVARWAKREPAKAALVATLLVAVPTIAALGGYYVASLPDLERARALRLDERFEAALERGLLEYWDQQYEKAIEAFDEARRLDPNRPEPLAGIALSRTRLAQPGAAIDLLEQHARTAPQHAVLTRLRGDALRQMGKDAAADDIERGLRPPQTALDLFLESARITNRGRPSSKDRGRALELATNAILRARHPRLIYLYQRSIAALYAGDEKAALQTADAIEELWPEKPVAWYMSANTVVHYDTPRAIRGHEKAIALDPSYGKAYALLGRLLIQDGDLERARDKLEKAVELRPRDWHSRVNLGYLHLRRQDRQAALPVFQGAVAARPDRPETHEGLARVLGELGDARGALAALRAGVAALPESARLRARLVGSLVADGQYLAARRECERGAARAANEPAGWLALARFLTEHHTEFDDGARAAIDAAERARKLAPDSPATLDVLANAWFAAGDVERALATQRKGLELIEKEGAVSERLRSAMRRSYRRFLRASRAKKE